MPEPLLSDDGNDLLLCPVCGFNYNHIQKVYTRMGYAPDEAKVFNGTLGIGQTDDEESCLVIEFQCEEFHNWELRLQENEGNITLAAKGLMTEQETKKAQRNAEKLLSAKLGVK